MLEPVLVHLCTVPELDLDRPFCERRVRLAAVPGVGVHLVVEDDGGERSNALEVLAVLHRADQAPEAATVEVWARFVGSELGPLASLGKGERPDPAKGKRRRWHASNGKRGWFTLAYEGADLGISSAFSLRVGREVGGDWRIELDGLTTAASWTAEILDELTPDEIFQRVKENRTDDKG